MTAAEFYSMTVVCSNTSTVSVHKIVDSNMYLKLHTNIIMADMLTAQKDFMLNMNVFQTADFLSRYRPGMWCSSSANKQVLKATCNNTLLITAVADPVTENHHPHHHQPNSPLVIAPDTRFITFYGSQGYGGGILTRLHIG
jgi:hypothetical protein